MLHCAANYFLCHLTVGRCELLSSDGILLSFKSPVAWAWHKDVHPTPLSFFVEVRLQFQHCIEEYLAWGGITMSIWQLWYVTYSLLKSSAHLFVLHDLIILWSFWSLNICMLLSKSKPQISKYVYVYIYIYKWPGGPMSGPPERCVCVCVWFLLNRLVYTAILYLSLFLSLSILARNGICRSLNVIKF